MKAPSAPQRGSARIPWRSGEFVALDFELTGLDRTRDEIISFGAVPVSAGRVQLGDAVYREVKPRVGPSTGSIKVHGLRSMDLENAPSLSMVAPDLSRVLSGRYLLTWVADVEIGFLRSVFGKPQWWWRRRTIDLVDLVRAHARHAPSTAFAGGDLSATAERYGVPKEDPHQALNDALMTAELFLVLAIKLATSRRTNVGDLLRI